MAQEARMRKYQNTWIYKWLSIFQILAIPSHVFVGYEHFGFFCKEMSLLIVAIYYDVCTAWIPGKTGKSVTEIVRTRLGPQSSKCPITDFPFRLKMNTRRSDGFNVFSHNGINSKFHHRHCNGMTTLGWYLIHIIHDDSAFHKYLLLSIHMHIILFILEMDWVGNSRFKVYTMDVLLFLI